LPVTSPGSSAFIELSSSKHLQAVGEEQITAMQVPNSFKVSSTIRITNSSASDAPVKLVQHFRGKHESAQPEPQLVALESKEDQFSNPSATASWEVHVKPNSTVVIQHIYTTVDDDFGEMI